MDKIKILYKNFFFVALVMLIFTSCSEDGPNRYDDRDDHYYSPLVGTWELIEDLYGPVPQSETNFITFYSDGAGLYEGYNINGVWDSWNTYWDSYYGSELIIYFPDGDKWYYFWEINKGYLYLYNMDAPNYYYIYRPVYW